MRAMGLKEWVVLALIAVAVARVLLLVARYRSTAKAPADGGALAAWAYPEPIRLVLGGGIRVVSTVIISRRGLHLDGDFVAWGAHGGPPRVAFFKPSPLPQLVVQLARGKGQPSRELALPVPPGREQKASAAAAALQRHFAATRAV